MVRNNVAEKYLHSRKKHIEGKAIASIQNFYLNPEYKEKVFEIPAKQNLTIKNAVIFEP